MKISCLKTIQSILYKKKELNNDLMLFLYGDRIINLQKLFPHLNITKIRALRILVHHFLGRGTFLKREYIYMAG